MKADNVFMKLKRLFSGIVFLITMGIPFSTRAEEILPEFFLHDFYNTTILYIGYERGCGTINEKMFSFIVRGATDFLMGEQNWTREETLSFLKSAALQIHQTTNMYIDKHGCDRFNFIVIENKDDYKILKDAFEIYLFEEPLDKSQITPL